jgi:hypothetical protein
MGDNFYFFSKIHHKSGFMVGTGSIMREIFDFYRTFMKKKIPQNSVDFSTFFLP